MHSSALEDYLKIIYKLEESYQNGKGVSTSEIALRLHISKASVSNMLKKLAEQGFLNYEPYYGVSLTEKGQKVALKMVRKHRILELFLVERLGYGWDEVDEEAEVLEHAISDKLTLKMWHDLGCPTRDPHGSPIPDEQGNMAPQNCQPLNQFNGNDKVIIERIKNRSPEELRYLEEIGLVKQALVKLIKLTPFKGPVVIDISGQQHAIDYQIANSIFGQGIQ